MEVKHLSQDEQFAFMNFLLPSYMSYCQQMNLLV